VFRIGEGGVHIQELAPGVSVDEVRERSEATIVTQ
jgi:acyl CoA:acetate/3-ketoacid CoA transferase beta subunit